MLTSIAPGVTALKDCTELRAATDRLETDSALRPILDAIAATLERGAGVAVLELDAQFTPNQAAELLGMSRPHLLSFMDGGALAFTRVGSHRRIAAADLVDFAKRRLAAGKFVAEALGNPARLDAAAIAEVAPISDAALAELDRL